MKKFEKGLVIQNVGWLANLLQSGHWVYYRDRPRHPSIILNMTLKTVLSGLEAGVICEAIHASSQENLGRQQRTQAVSATQ